MCCSIMIAWAHYPQLFELLSRRGLGLVSLVLLVLFLVGIWKVVRPRGTVLLTCLKTGCYRAFCSSSPSPQAPEIEHEAEQQTVEAKATAREALPLTIKELRSVEDMEQSPSSGRKTPRRQRDKVWTAMIGQQIASLLGKALGQERLFKANLLRLAKILQHLRVMSVKELGEMRNRMSKATGNEKKLLKAELEKEREKTVIFETVMELRKRLEQGIKQFEAKAGRGYRGTAWVSLYSKFTPFAGGVSAGHEKPGHHYPGGAGLGEAVAGDFKAGEGVAKKGSQGRWVRQ